MKHIYAVIVLLFCVIFTSTASFANTESSKEHNICFSDDSLYLSPDHWLLNEDQNTQISVLAYLSDLNLWACSNNLDLITVVLQQRERQMDQLIGRERRLDLENEFQQSFNVSKTLDYVKTLEY